jgi:hypothetical protein
MSMLEAGLRGGTAATLLLVAILFLRDSGRTPAGRNCALFLLSAAGYVICSAPGVASLETPLGLSLLAVSLGLPALFWISAAAAFDDEFKPSWRRGCAWLGLAALGMWSLLDSRPILGFAYYASSASRPGTRWPDGRPTSSRRAVACARCWRSRPRRTARCS